jgi:diacylglycerol kinase family enzyme
MKRNPIVDYRSDVDSLVIDMDEPVPYQVDGDDLGDATSLHFRYEPDALTLVVP